MSSHDLFRLVDIKTDDISDYKHTAMLLVFPNCLGKCKNCQNSKLQKRNKFNDIFVTAESIINYYNRLKTHSAIVCAGLEPFDSFYDLKDIFECFVDSAKKPENDFVIYTGYYYDEIKENVDELHDYLKRNNKNSLKRLIIKFGRYDETQPNRKGDVNPILGVTLATCNQYVVSYESNEL